MSEMQSTVLIVDDEASPREALRLALSRDYRPLTAAGEEEAFSILAREPVEVVLLDIILDGRSGLDVLGRIRVEYPQIPVVMVTALNTVETAVEAMKRGACDYVAKPFPLDEIRIRVSKAIDANRLRKDYSLLVDQLKTRDGLVRLVGASTAMARVREQLLKVSDSDCTVLVTGESGTGKELAARAIHVEGARASRPFVPLNSVAFTPELIESELFGHEKGAFTGAFRAKPGMFEMAEGGTLFLDEIGDMPPAIQGKLLRALQDRKIRRVGGLSEIRVDVRLIVATHQDLDALIRAGKFRSDLYYRINVVKVEIPPLRNRLADIPELVRHFVAELSSRSGRPSPSISPLALDVLMAHRWPGNVRELENAIEHALVTMEGDKIEPWHLPKHVACSDAADTGSHHVSDAARATTGEALGGEITLRGATERVERMVIEQALEKAGGVLTEAARLLGTTRRILKYKMDKLGMGGDSNE